MHNNNITFAIIKPNAVRTGKTGPILAMITEGGFEISAMRMVLMNKSQAESFYEIHRGKSFFDLRTGRSTYSEEKKCC